MCSPAGHILIGAACWFAFAPRAGLERAPRFAALAATIFLANGPDLDYLPGLALGDLNRWHYQGTHSLLFAVLLALAVAWVFRRRIAPRAAVLPVFLIASLSHLAADFMTIDLGPPPGIPLLWPLSDARFISPVPLFVNFQKATLEQLFTAANLGPLLREILLTAPLAAGLAAAARFRRSRHAA